MPLTALEQRLCRDIADRADDLLADLRLHVNIPTGGNHRAGLEETRERLTTRLARLGARTELIPGDPRPDWLYGVAKRRCGSGAGGGGGNGGGGIPPTAVCRRDADITTGQWAARAIALSGHMDTVHDPADPFNTLTLSADGRTATGPGCVDMKGGLVIAVAALESLESAGVRIPWTFILNSDEETGSYCSERAIRAEAERLLRQTPARSHEPVALVFEPAAGGAEGALVTERAGSGQFIFEARGRSAHVGRDFPQGISAVTALARCILDAADLTDLARGLIANISPIEGGHATNAVADLARAWGNLRFKDQAGGEQLARRLHEIAARHTAPPSPGPGLPRVEAKVSLVRAAKPATEGAMRLAHLARRVSEDLGRPLPFTTTAGVCDGNILQGAGLPCIDTLGVRGGALHTPQEWIEIPSLVERCQMAAIVMLRLAEGQ